MTDRLLEIEDLCVDFPTQGAVLHAVDGVSLALDAGEVLGVVGESGSGKSVTMLALMGLVGFPGQVRAQAMRFAGHDLRRLAPRERRRIVGKDVAMIFQDPTTSLNPCFTVGFQLGSNPYATQLLSDCAGSSQRFFKAENRDELRAAFIEIATQLTTLRLAN